MRHKHTSGFLDVGVVPVYGEDGIRLDETVPNVVLLSDSGGSILELERSRRDVISTQQSLSTDISAAEEKVTEGDSDLGTSSTAPGATVADFNRGYAQSSEDFLKDVDIGEQTIKKTIESKNYSVSNDNVGSSCSYLIVNSFPCLALSITLVLFFE